MPNETNEFFTIMIQCECGEVARMKLTLDQARRHALSVLEGCDLEVPIESFQGTVRGGDG